MRKRISVLLLTVLLSVVPAAAQLYTAGNEPGGVRWRQITTQSYKVVYPEGMDSLARVYAANLDVRKYSEANDGIDLGTTLVICGIISGHAYVANVGDSRLYLLNRYAYSIRQITKDHSYVEEMVARGLMTRNSEEYMRQKSVITRAVGFFPETEPDLFDFSLEEGDMILLCSDGLTNMLKNVVIKYLALDDSFTLERRVDTLIDEANHMGGRDNITVILAEREDQDD